MNKGILFLFLILFSEIGSIAQNRIGTWRSHLPYSNVSNILMTGEKVYCATGGGLFFYNSADNSIEKLSKENGLSDTDVSALGYSEELGIILIAYANANLDILHNNKIFNLPDIMRKQILGEKRINSIMVKDKFAYLSTGFGIVAVNLDSTEISETYIIGEGGAQIKVNETCIEGQNIYAATDQGIYRADINSSNLQDFNYWNRVTDIPNFNKKFNSITVVDGTVYTSFQSENAFGDLIYFWDGMSWNTFTDFKDDKCNRLNSSNGKLIISATNLVRIYNSDRQLVMSELIGSPKSAFLDQNSVLWVGDSEQGLIKVNGEGSNFLVISPNGPSTHFVSDIKVMNNILYTVPGGPNSSGNNQFRHSEINTFNNNKWTSIKTSDYRDFYRIAIDPDDPEHYFIGSWGWGLFEYKKDSLIEIYRDENSTLQTAIPGDYFRLGGLTFDKTGNLWVSNASVSEPISVFIRKDGKLVKWESFLKNLVNQSKYPFTGEIIVTQQGYKWMLLTPGRGILAFDDNGTLENPDDDRHRIFDVNDINNDLITNEIYSIAEDEEGNIWLGSNKGVLVYYNPSGVFDGDNFYAQQILIPRNDGSGDADPLLGTESVSVITVDGANRKWLGTKNAGVSLVSPDGQTQVHNFTAENSPLLSNTISSIAINNKSGEVFFGTDKGIISYMADATGPAENFESVFIFPNPVREDFTGDVAIIGLLANSTVKITDLNGNLCFESVSLGGQVLWNGKNFRGERVGTGVYLVFCSSEDGSLSRVTKLLFIH